MTREVLLSSSQATQAKQQGQDRYFEKMRNLYTYDLESDYASFNGNIACLSATGFKKILLTLPSPKLAILTIYKLLMMSIAGVYAWLKSLVKGYPFPSFQDYYFFFFKQADKQYLENFLDDSYFGLQRVSGANPTWIRGLSTTKDCNLLEKLPVAEVVQNLTGKNYKQALAEKRLYLADYSVLKVMVDNLKKLPNGRQQYTTNPLALFYRQDDGLLKPLAIKLYGTEVVSQQNPLFTPEHGNHWTMAKFYVQNADLIIQNCWTHSVRTHYLVGSLLLGTYRNFSAKHPLFVLLKPHWQDTLAVNASIRFYRPKHKGEPIPLFGAALPCTQDTLGNFFGQGMRTYSFQKMAFPEDLKQQQLEDPELFFPYRDDGKLIWEAIEEFVSQYVRLYYQSDRDVIADAELQAWGTELGGSITEDKMGIPDFPTEFQTVTQVIETVRNIIFLATAQHNCVHYSLYKYVAFAPNMPFSLMAPPNTNLDEPISEADLSKLMPPLKNVLVQSLGFYLNFIQANQLGDYKLNQFEPQAQQLIRQYQTKLSTIAKEIESRNQQRVEHGQKSMLPKSMLSYDLMNPKHIANSITG